MPTEIRRSRNRLAKAAELARKREAGFRAVSLFLTEDDLRLIDAEKAANGHTSRSHAVRALFRRLHAEAGKPERAEGEGAML